MATQTGRYKKTCPEAEQHLGLVHEMAKRVWRRTGRQAEYGDLVNSGVVGLMQAIASYDPGRGVTFSTYSSRRIEGAILDEVRRFAPGSRGSRRRMRGVQAAERALRQELDRGPTHGEVAERLGVEEASLWRWKDAGDSRGPVSLEDMACEGGVRSATRTVAESLVGTGAEEIEESVSRAQEVERLTEEMKRLPETERIVLVLYFAREMKLREIGRVLGVSESRVSQIRTAALGRLRGRLAPMSRV